MDFTNINDPAGINALLQSLRSSQAWAELQQTAEQQPPTAPTSQTVPTPAIDTTEDEPLIQDTGTTPSVADLLARLQNTARPAPVTLQPSSSYSPQPPPNPAPVDAAEAFLRESLPKREQRKDLRTLSLQQSLPVLAELSERQDCVQSIAKLKKDQDDLERKLWEERESILQAQQEKVKAAVTKANIIGTGISEREAKTMSQSFQKEFEKFDKECVLPAWDNLIARQQMALEKLGVPSMFASNEKVDRERQQRVVQVLEGIVGAEGK